MGNNLPSEPPPFSFQKLIKQWEDQRMRPEHRGESIVVFYVWRAFTIGGAVLAYLACQLGFPVSVVILDHFWPEIASSILAITLFLLIALGFFAGFFLAKIIDTVILYIELHTSVPRPSA